MANFFVSNPKEVARLILVRHGRTQSNKEARIGTMDDVPIDATGLRQAQAVAERLKVFKADVLYSSPLLRAQQTAQPISAALNLAVRLDADLVEFDFGIVSDKTVAEIKQEYPEVHEQMQAWLAMGEEQTGSRPNYPGGEDIHEFEKRMRRFRDKVIDQHTGQVVIAVTHMAVIKGILNLVFNRNLTQRMNCTADNTSVTVIDYHRRVPILRLFNDIHHLDMELAFGRVTLL